MGLSIVGPMGHVKTDMFPNGESTQLHLGYALNGIYRLDELEKSINLVEHWLDQHRDELHIKNLYSYMSEQGDAMTNVLLEDPTEASGSGIVDRIVGYFKPPFSSKKIMEKIRTGAPKIPVGRLVFDDQSRNSNSDGMQVFINGDSGAALRELSGPVIQALQHVPGLRDVRTGETSGDREIAVHVDREKAQGYGFSANQVAQFIQIALRGMPLKEFRSGTSQIPVWLRFQNSDAQNLEDLADYKVRRTDGSLIPLMSLVEFNGRDAPSSIERENRQTALSIKASLAEGTTMEEVKPKMEAALNALQFPPGYRWSYGRNFEFANEAGRRMLFNTLIALLLVYIVMCAMFESMIYPAAILTTFVFSIFGVYWLFWLTGTTFSIMSSIGVLILMGVVVNNGIVMIVHINQLRLEGMDRRDALIQGARDRLRPVMMTMGTAILGMVPLCLSNAGIGGDGPPYYPMARAIAGGLVFSTLVTLVALPTIYALLDDMRLWTRRTLGDSRRSVRVLARASA
jgi:HAE1 family hydrophobic/amphiphilic exporter-1